MMSDVIKVKQPHSEFDNYSSELNKIIKPKCVVNYIKDKNKDNPIKPNAVRTSIYIPLGLITEDLIVKINDLLINNKVIDNNLVKQIKGLGTLYLDLKSRLKENENFIKDLNKLGYKVIGSYMKSFDERLDYSYVSELLLNNDLMYNMPQLKDFNIRSGSCSQEYKLDLFNFTIGLSDGDQLNNIINSIKELDLNILIENELIIDKYYMTVTYDLSKVFNTGYIKALGSNNIIPVKDYLLFEGINHEYRLSKRGRIFYIPDVPELTDVTLSKKYKPLHVMSTTDILRSFGGFSPYSLELTTESQHDKLNCRFSWDSDVSQTNEDDLNKINKDDTFNLMLQEINILKDIFKFLNRKLNLSTS